MGLPALGFQNYIETNRENINDLLCELNSESHTLPNKVVKLKYISRFRTSERAHPAARGIVYDLDSDGKATAYPSLSSVFCNNKEYTYLFGFLGNVYPITSFQILGKPREYEQTVSTALSTSGMQVDALSKLILSYISLIFDPSNTEFSAGFNPEVSIESNTESSFWNKCTVL